MPVPRFVRSFLRKLLRLLLLIAISLLATEISLFLAQDWLYADAMYVYDAEIGFVVPPGHDWYGHRTNRFGFNDREHALQKPADSYRVLTLSDSFGWIGGYEGNWATLLEEELMRDPGSVEVINVGYPGTAIDHQLALLERWGLDYDPDLVVLGFYVGNDIFDAQPDTRIVPVGGQIMQIEGREWRILGKPWVGRSQLATFAKRIWAERTMRAGQRAAATDPAPAAPTDPFDLGPVDYPLADWYLHHLQAHVRIIQSETFGEYADNEAFVAERLEAMRALLAERGIPLLVVAFPDEMQVNPQVRDQLLERSDIDPEQDWERPQRWLEARCDELGIAYVDLLPAFRRAQAAGQGLYVPNDSHWNRAGNVLVAGELATLLRPRILQTER
jgi:hypothetical protein